MEERKRVILNNICHIDISDLTFINDSVSKVVGGFERAPFQGERYISITAALHV